MPQRRRSNRLLQPTALALLGGLALVGFLAWHLRRARTSPAGPARPGPASLARAEAGRPPDLLFDPPAVDVGALLPRAQAAVEAPWRRTGPGPLVVYGIRPDCGCLRVEGLPRDLPEGAAGRLRVAIEAPRRPGPFRYRIRVITDGRRSGGRELLVLPVLGYVDREVVARPDVLDVGRRTAGRPLTRSMEVRATPAAAKEQIGARLEGLAGRVKVGGPRIRGHDGWCLDLELVVPETPGPFEGVVVVTVGARTPLRIPVRGRAVAQPTPPRAGSAR